MPVQLVQQHCSGPSVYDALNRSGPSPGRALMNVSGGVTNTGAASSPLESTRSTTARDGSSGCSGFTVIVAMNVDVLRLSTVCEVVARGDSVSTLATSIAPGNMPGTENM